MNGPDRTVASVTSVRSRLSGCGQAGCDSGAVNGVRACICPVARCFAGNCVCPCPVSGCAG